VKRGLEGVVVPSKMYSILAAGKPIVALAPAECDVVTVGARKGFSIAANPDDPAQFVQAVRRIYRNPELLRSMGAAAATAAPEYDRGKQLAKFVEIVSAIAEC